MCLDIQSSGSFSCTVLMPCIYIFNHLYQNLVYEGVFDFMSNANANDIIIAKQHVVSSTYERRIYAVVIFSALKSEKGGVFRGIRTSKKITIPASSLWQRRDSDLERKTKTFSLFARKGY